MKKWFVLLLALLMLPSFALGEEDPYGGFFAESSAPVFRDGCVWIKNGAGLYGLLDKSGEWLIEPAYEDARYLGEGVSSVSQVEAGSIMLVDRSGNKLFDGELEALYDFSDGLLLAEGDGLPSRWAYLNAKGEIVIECDPSMQYYPFSNRRAMVCSEEGLYGFINTKGELVIPCKYERACEFSGKRAVVSEDGVLWGVIDQTGAVQGAFKWHLYQEMFEVYEDWAAPYYQNGYLLVCDDEGRVTFLNQKGDEIGSYWADARPFSEGFAAVGKDFYNWGYIDTRGKLVIPCKYEEVGPFHQGRAAAYYDGWGVINEKGVTVTEFLLDEVGIFTEGYAPVSKFGWAYINRAGHLPQEYPWNRAGNFVEGLAPVENESGLLGYIAPNGEEIVKCVWDEIGPFSDGLAWVSGEDGRGFVNTHGRMVISLDD